MYLCVFKKKCVQRHSISQCSFGDVGEDRVAVTIGLVLEVAIRRTLADSSL